MNKKAMSKKFKASMEKSKGRNADVLAAALVETAIENDCECVVFVRDNNEDYSARAIAMAPENIAYQFAKTILAMHRNAGINPVNFLDCVSEIVKSTLERRG